MKQNNKWNIRFAAATLTAVALCGGVALAAAGDRDDPLITVSYLKETIIPDFLDNVEKDTKRAVKNIESDVEDLIDDYEKEMTAFVENLEGGEVTVSTSYALVTLTQGQTLLPSVGSEILLRTGDVSIYSTTEPAMIDTTTGESLKNGGHLAENHLNMTTFDDSILTAEMETTLLVRGTYEVR